jgi:hypothetical protein
MWEPLAATLIAKHTVIVPDLRGMGLSEHVAAGYDKKTKGRDVSALLDVDKPLPAYWGGSSPPVSGG